MIATANPFKPPLPPLIPTVTTVESLVDPVITDSSKIWNFFFNYNQIFKKLNFIAKFYYIN